MDARELEVRCLHCNAGFAAGTRSCVHCQRPLGGTWQRRQFEVDAASRDGDVPDGPAAADFGLWGRLGPGLLTVVLIGISVLSKVCVGDFSHGH
jgi:hypothetical protein